MSETHNATATNIELSQPRVIALQGRKGVYTLTCRRVTKEDWAAFFGAIVNTTKREGLDRVNTLDVTGPQLLLAERVLVDAAGYKVAHGDKLTELPDWQKLVPMEHRMAVGSMLASARPMEEQDDETIYSEGQPVSLRAVWSAKEDGSMASVIGLVHVLKAPSEAQYRRYTREASRARVMGGSRAGETVYPGAQMVLAALYDELVQSVDGYTFQGQPLSGREAIVQEMDTHHKVIAAQQIFEPRTQVAPVTAAAAQEVAS